MDIFKKHLLNISSVKIIYDEEKDKKIPYFKNNWLNIKDNINLSDNGFYIKTGKKNNITVIDIDNINLDHNKQLIELINKTCPTLTESTSKGLHFYFKYNLYLESSNDSILKIDILNDNKCVFCAPTTYKKHNEIVKYTILEDRKINEIHNDVIEYYMSLKINDNKKITKNNKKIIRKENIRDKQYFITCDELEDKLSRLPQEYLNNYDKWIQILTIIKNSDYKSKKLYDIFNNWSKYSTKYNTDNNILLYNNNKGNLNINFMNYILKDKKIYPHYNLNTMLELNKKIKQNNILSRYLDLEYDIFRDNKTIIIKSDTGTGKTTCISKNIKELMTNNKDLNLISLVSRISLSHQHIKNFKNNDIKLSLYQDIDKKRIDEYERRNIVCCINSLLLLKDFDFTNSIVYIDEIDSFITSLVDNETIKNIRMIYLLLMKIINTCNKLILSDATITNVIFKFCENRRDENKIYINNVYKSNKNTKAIQCNNENEFMNLMKEDIENKKYFLACSDKAEKITQLYNNDIKYGNQEDFILITAESKIQINDAQERFKSKYVYYSPSIIYGVDYNNEEKQNVYIYITGCSISPIALYQQINRTRNIDKIYFYIDPSIKHDIIKYKTIEKTEEYFKNAIDNFESIDLLKECCNIDDERKIIENSFFKLFCYNEYVKNIYNNNKESHFKMILHKKGFIIKNIGKCEKISNELKKEMKETIKNNNDNKFEKYVENYNELEYEDFEQRRKYLNIEIEKVNDYKEYIINKNAIEKHLNIINYFKSDEVINKKINELKENKFNEIIYNHNYVKIKVLRDILKKYNISQENINYGDKNKKINLDEKDEKIIKSTFRIKSNINNLHEFNKMHINMIRNIAPIILSNKKRKGKETYYYYEFNNELINEHKKIAELRNNKNECLF